jgi:hypothetical protein
MGTRLVKIDSETVDAVEVNKTKTGVPIGKYFEQAAKEKMIRERIRNADKVGGKKK